ncbi:hypothetical protein HWV62_45689 [Athelia sp. TMB]|nr:hypothetical protein HWV62_45689 [Athelia sp. TMB]
MPRIQDYQFFPHEVADMSILLEYMKKPDGPYQTMPRWSLRYVILMWLSLVCMIPFDLEQFDEPDQAGGTAKSVESLAKQGLSMGIIQVLCELLKSAPIEEIQSKTSDFLAIASSIGQCPLLENNTVIRKMKLKLLSRLALRFLPAKSRVSRKGLAMAGGASFGGFAAPIEQDDIEVPEEVETVLEELLKGLQDRDTIVRWSAAKGIARVSERLPVDFADQIFENIVSLFAIHSIAAASLYDLPSVAERPWHGACLGSAEMARRGLISDENLPGLIKWLSKALYFDIRKGAHSIGSNVRDAAAYALWSLARAQDPASLKPHVTNLAQILATVSLYDREIHIRRAASAAFQEHVGRMGLFPHGIDVLRKTDFYAVSVRRNSFIVAAAQVAEHLEYRAPLINHLLTVTLRHWDVSMRQLGAQSLRAICEIDLDVLGKECASKAAKLFQSVDIFEMLFKIPHDVVTEPRNDLIMAAACNLIASSILPKDIQLDKDSESPQWRTTIDAGLRHRNPEVQRAAAHAMASVSAPPMQQSLPQLIGALDYDAHPHSILNAVQCLLESVETSSPKRMANIEARVNCFTAMPQILQTTVPRLSIHLSPSVVYKLFNALLGGLEDYTLDQRGDVGSWVRMACIKGLSAFAVILSAHATDIPNYDEYLPADQYHAAISGILKQGVERLDVVRQVAGEHMAILLQLPPPQSQNSRSWEIEQGELMKMLFLSDPEADGWKDSAWLFPKARGPVATSLITYAQDIPLQDPANSQYDLLSLISDILNYAKSNLKSNTVVVPLATRNLARLKSVERVLESMKLVINLLPYSSTFGVCLGHLSLFLAHAIPKVRSDAAEHLYLVIQGKDLDCETENAEDILLETEWSSIDIATATVAANSVARLLIKIED